MLTTGINTQEQINAFKSENKEAREECALRDMMFSCFAYGTLDRNDTYIKPYQMKLGLTVFNEVFEEQAKFLRGNYMVNRDTYTDHEGCTYNSLVKFTKD